MAFQGINKFLSTATCQDEYICVTILLEQLSLALHANHAFFVTVKATNAVELSVTGTSDIIRYLQQMPSVGVVFDVAPSAIGQHIAFGVRYIDPKF